MVVNMALTDIQHAERQTGTSRDNTSASSQRVNIYIRHLFTFEVHFHLVHHQVDDFVNGSAVVDSEQLDGH
jgi:hypothetical protein